MIDEGKFSADQSLLSRVIRYFMNLKPMVGYISTSRMTLIGFEIFRMSMFICGD